MKRRALFGLLAVVMCLSGCSFKAEDLMEVPAPTRYPQLEAQEDFREPPDASAGDLTLQVTTSDGLTVESASSACAQLLYDAAYGNGERSQADENTVAHAVHKVAIRQGDRVLTTVLLTDDGTMVGVNTLGEVFLCPEYVYGWLESRLWSVLSSFNTSPLTWNPEEGSAAVEVRLPQWLRAMLCRTVGYADTYLTSFRLLDITQDGAEATAYFLVNTATFELDTEQEVLKLVHQYYTAVSVTLDRLDRASQQWRLGDLAMADRSGATASERKTALRAVLPFELMETAQTMLDDETLRGTMEKEVRLQAMQWLQEHGLGRYSVHD